MVVGYGSEGVQSFLISINSFIRRPILPRGSEAGRRSWVYSCKATASFHRAASAHGQQHHHSSWVQKSNPSQTGDSGVRLVVPRSGLSWGRVFLHRWPSVSMLSIYLSTLSFARHVGLLSPPCFTGGPASSFPLGPTSAHPHLTIGHVTQSEPSTTCGESRGGLCFPTVLDLLLFDVQISKFWGLAKPGEKKIWIVKKKREEESPKFLPFTSEWMPIKLVIIPSIF